MSDSIDARAVWRVQRGELRRDDDRVAVEQPVALLFNDRPFAVMLASPSDLQDFALGFALAEGIVERADDYRLLDIERRDDAIALHGWIPQAQYDRLQARTRNLSGRGGCGLCGEALLHSIDGAPPAVDAPTPLPLSWIRRGLERLRDTQPLSLATGGSHAAAFVDADSMLVREDIGRHNAVDKLIGALALQPARAGALLVTSRASYEIVAKAAHGRLAVVVAISAPTTLAIDLAERCGITLAAFARADALTIYTHRQRLLG